MGNAIQSNYEDAPPENAEEFNRRLAAQRARAVAAAAAPPAPTRRTSTEPALNPHPDASTSTAAAGAAADVGNAGGQHVCRECGAAFASRNRLFKHLKVCASGCGDGGLTAAMGAAAGGAEGGVGGASNASASESSLAYLAGLSLSQYVETFDAEGYGAASNLQGMTLVELKGKLGMKTGHAKMLLRYLAKI